MYKNIIEKAITEYLHCPFFESNALWSMANMYHEGKLAFWKKKKFEYLETMRERSLIGYAWVNSNCPELTMNNCISLVNDFVIESFNKKYYAHLDQSQKDQYAKEDIEEFFRLYFEFRTINTILINLDQNRTKDKPENFQSIFKEGAYGKAIDWLRNCSKINESGVYSMGQSEFVEFVLALHFKNYLSKEPNSTDIIEYMKNVGISPLSPQQINNIRRKHRSTDFNSQRSGTTFQSITTFS